MPLLSATYLVSTRLGNHTQVSDINSLGEGTLVRSIKDSIEGNVLQNLVDTELVGIEDHFCSSSGKDGMGDLR